MLKKKWIVAFGILVVVAVMVSLDLYKSHQEEKPPLPILKVGEQEVGVTLGPFTWNAGEMNIKERDEFPEGVQETPINPLQHLSILFPEEQPKQIEVYYWDPNFEMDMNMLGGDFQNGQEVNIPNQVGPFILTIEAKWDGKKKAKYYVAVHREQVVSYQHLLSEDDLSYSVFALHDSPVIHNPFYDVSGQIPISKWKGSDDLQSTQTQYPELNITEKPTYLLFDDEKLLFKTNEEEEIIRFFEKIFKPITKTFGGTIFKIDRDNKIVDVYYRKKFYYEDIDSLKIGQEIRTEVTFSHLTDPSHTEVHSLSVMADPPDELLVDSFRTKESNQFNLVAFGDNNLFKQLDEYPELNNLVEMVILETSPPGGIPLMGYVFVLFDEKGPVLISHHVSDILKYLKEHLNM